MDLAQPDPYPAPALLLMMNLEIPAPTCIACENLLEFTLRPVLSPQPQPCSFPILKCRFCPKPEDQGHLARQFRDAPSCCALHGIYRTLDVERSRWG